MLHEVSSQKDLLATAGQVSQATPQRIGEQKDPSTESGEAQAEHISDKDLQQALSRVREVFQKADPRLEFSVDQDTDRVGSSRS
ncbi:MAG: flagellar protein FlaG [Nitrospiraceae bacterium]